MGVALRPVLTFARSYGECLLWELSRPEPRGSGGQFVTRSGRSSRTVVLEMLHHQQAIYFPSSDKSASTGG